MGADNTVEQGCTGFALFRIGGDSRKTPAIPVGVDDLGGLLKVPRRRGQLGFLFDQPERKLRWIKAARSAKHEARNLALLCHAVDRVWGFPKHLGYLFHVKQTGKRIESGQDVEWCVKRGLTPNRAVLRFQR